VGLLCDLVRWLSVSEPCLPGSCEEGRSPGLGKAWGRWVSKGPGQLRDQDGLQVELLPFFPGRVTLSNVSERKDNMRLGLSLATNPKDNSFLVRATAPALPSLPATQHCCMGWGEAGVADSSLRLLCPPHAYNLYLPGCPCAC
jgi:hypothetical protein